MSRPRRRKILIAIGAIVLVIAAVLLLVQDEEFIYVQSAYSAEDPRFPAYVGAIGGSPVTRGGSFEVLTNGVEILPAMLSAIDGARTRIVFESYIFSDGEYGKRFAQALAAAAQRGVRVFLLLDAIGAKDIGDDNEKVMTDAGVHLAWFNRAWQLQELNGRTHRKILVVDGTIGFTGGASVADHWAGNADSEDHWRDTHFRIEGPPVRYLEACFFENWIESAGVVVPVIEEEAALIEDVAGGPVSVPVWSSPVGGHGRVKKLFLLSIAAARRTLDIQTPYFVMDGSTKWSLLQAAGRGVRVRLLLEGDLTDAKAVKHAGRAGYEELLEAGVEIYEYQPTMMHTKALIADGAWSVIGSSNLDNRSLELNDENNIGVAERKLSEALLADFEADLAKTSKVELAAWRERPWMDRAKQRFWAFFGELF
ncbi:MAG: phospholipase D-like domain-containing protein [Acidobacteriota bacterium]|nr:phospholipase D-like domain-containing protein [Acidobacteriota bacterium]